MLEGKPMNLKGSGSRTKTKAANKVPFKEPKPPIMTIDKTGISCNKVKEEGSIKVM